MGVFSAFPLSRRIFSNLFSLFSAFVQKFCYSQALDMFPFTATQQLNNELDNFKRTTAHQLDKTLPGYPRIKLRDICNVFDFLEREFYSVDAEQMAGKMWWFSKRDSRSISPIRHQRVKGRNIVVTENPKLHLVWIKGRVFIKPLPEYLL
jgi:hypothetical protein